MLIKTLKSMISIARSVEEDKLRMSRRKFFIVSAAGLLVPKAIEETLSIDLKSMYIDVKYSMFDMEVDKNFKPAFLEAKDLQNVIDKTIKEWQDRLDKALMENMYGERSDSNG